MKEIKEDTNKWKGIPCLRIGRISVVKISILPKAIIVVIATPIKISIEFFTKIKILK